MEGGEEEIKNADPEEPTFSFGTWNVTQDVPYHFLRQHYLDQVNRVEDGLRQTTPRQFFLSAGLAPAPRNLY